MYIRSVAAIPLVNTSTEERVNKHCEAVRISSVKKQYACVGLRTLEVHLRHFISGQTIIDTFSLFL
jgi:hypothetical protein